MGCRIDDISVEVLDVPTASPRESDGTATWTATTMVLVQLRAGGVPGLGYSYVTGAAARVVEGLLAPCIRGEDPSAIPALHARMVRAVRNHGRAGIAACAIAAVDIALWDVKARLHDMPLSTLIGPSRDEVPVYASGGFTSTNGDDLGRELATYAEAGYRRAKIKIGAPIADAIARVELARAAAPALELMVDANGAFTRKEARALVERLEALGVVYFEEPVTSDDLEGLRLLRDTSRLAIAAGEYGYDASYFRRMLEAVDILQADSTRCLGFTGFLQADALCDAFTLPLSSHCAPALHAHVGRCARRLAHVENFFDHVRLEAMLFDGAPVIAGGALTCDWTRPGLGLTLRRREAARFAA